MALVWDHYPGTGEFLTALCLADHADHDGGSIFPSVARIAKKTQQSERTIQRHLAAMRASGWLQVVKNSSGKPGEATTYRIPVELIPIDDGLRVTKLHPLAKSYPHGCHQTHGRVTNSAKTGDTAMSPKLGLPVITHQGRVEKNRKAKPLRAQTNGELITKALTLGISTTGLDRKALVRAIEVKTQ